MAKEQKRELRREDLAKAALRVIAQQGLGAATVREVAREAGCSPGLITHYAKTMDDLLLAAAAYSTSEAKARILPLITAYQGLEAIRRLALGSLPLNRGRIDAWKLWISFWDMSRPSVRIKQVLDEHLAVQRRLYRRLIQSALDLEEISPDIDPARSSESLMVFIHGVGVVTVLKPSSMPAKRQKALLEDWIEAVLRPA